MDPSSIASQVRAIASLSEHVDAAPADIGVVDALIAARTLLEVVQDRCLDRGQDDVVQLLEPATEAIDLAIGKL